MVCAVKEVNREYDRTDCGDSLARWTGKDISRSQQDCHTCSSHRGRSDLLNIRAVHCSAMVEKVSLPHEKLYPDLTALLQAHGVVHFLQPHW